MANLQAFWKIEVRDKNGKIVATQRGRSKSFVIAFLGILQNQFQQIDGPNAITIANVTRTLRNHAYNFGINGGVSDTSKGIVVGTGVTAPSNTDYELTTLITSGSGAGQLNYGAQSFTAAQVVGVNVDFVLTRTWQNLSGGTVTVQEIGIHALAENTLTSSDPYLIVHDLATQAVANNQTLTVTYTLRTTV